MPRKLLDRTNVYPYHVTARVDNREVFPLRLEEMWRIVGSESLLLSLIYGVQFHSMVLMPNHIHILVTVPEYDLGIVMNVWMSGITRTVNRISGRSGHLFGGPYHWTLIRSSRYFGHALKYVYRNPVKGGLCQRVEDYQFSSLHGAIGRSHLPLPLYFTEIGLELNIPWDDHEWFLDWLNNPFPSEEEQIIAKGLRKKIFEKTLTKNRRVYEPLEKLL